MARLKNLNPKAQLTIKIDNIKLSNIARDNNINKSQLIQLLDAVLNQTLGMMMEDVIAWILRFVPKRTGQLRFTLLENMKSSRVRGGILYFRIGTQLNYAPRVNAMSTSQVQHNSWFENQSKKKKWKKIKGKRLKRRRLPPAKRAYAYYWGHEGRIFLNDPEALGGFWGHLLVFIKKRAIVNLAKAMKYQYGVTKLPWVIA